MLLVVEKRWKETVKRKSCLGIMRWRFWGLSFQSGSDSAGEG